MHPSPTKTSFIISHAGAESESDKSLTNTNAGLNSGVGRFEGRKTHLIRKWCTAATSRIAFSRKSLEGFSWQRQHPAAATLESPPPVASGGNLQNRSRQASNTRNARGGGRDSSPAALICRRWLLEQHAAAVNNPIFLVLRKTPGGWQQRPPPVLPPNVPEEGAQLAILR
jgi:hypothetical protein